jgi:hypothetical protein
VEAEVVDRRDHAPDLVVRRLLETGVDLHLARVERAHVGVEGVPRGEDVGARRQPGVGGDDAELLLARERLLAQLVPALIELPLVLLAPLRRDVVRRMARARREVHEERAVR